MHTVLLCVWFFFFNYYFTFGNFQKRKNQKEVTNTKTPKQNVLGNDHYKTYKNVFLRGEEKRGTGVSRTVKQSNIKHEKYKTCLLNRIYLKETIMTDDFSLTNYCVLLF